MLARLGIEIILFVAVTVCIYLLFIKLLHSAGFGGLVKQAKPGPETDEEVLGAFEQADTTADRRAEQVEQEAIEKINSAAKLKARRRPSQK